MGFDADKVNELRVFFDTAELPSSVRLTQGAEITDVSKFIESHFNVLDAAGNKPVFEVFYLRLLQLKEIIAAENQPRQ
jgi:hypothetical protein